MMRQAQLLLVELFLMAFATVSALVLTDNFEVSEPRLVDFMPYVTLAAAAAILPSLRTCRSVWRFTAMADYLRILAADGTARALPILQGMLIRFFLVGVRILAGLWYAARERSVQLKAPKEAFGCKTVLVVGLGTPADLYLRSVAQFAPDRVRIAGLLGDIVRHIGRSIHGHPILGTPEQIAGALCDLKIHGVFVDRIVVATTFEKLSP